MREVHMDDLDICTKLCSIVFIVVYLLCLSLFYVPIVLENWFDFGSLIFLFDRELSLHTASCVRCLSGVLGKLNLFSSLSPFVVTLFQYDSR